MTSSYQRVARSPHKFLFICTWLVSFLLAGPLSAQQREVYILTASEWNVPRTSEAILAMPALQKTVTAYRKHKQARIQIHYPGGDEGTLWVNELRSWLVSLGISSQHIELLPGSRGPEQVELEVIQMSAARHPIDH